MKRLMLTLLSLLVAAPILVGTMVGLYYYSIGESSVPRTAMTVLDKRLTPCGYSWNAPVFGGLLARKLEKTPADAFENLGTLEDVYISLPTLDTDDKLTVRVHRADDLVWSGKWEEMSQQAFARNGEYQVRVTRACAPQANGGWGTLQYRFAFTVRLEPYYKASDEWLLPGEVLAVRVGNLDDNVQPRMVTDFGRAYFVQTGEAEMTGYLPIPAGTEPAIYEFELEAGSQKWPLSLRVTRPYIEHRDISTKNDSAELRAAVSAAAKAEMAEVLMPLYEDEGRQRLWAGSFAEPVAGEVTTGYSVHQYVDDATRPQLHAGLDYEAEPGTPVLAPGAGVVVFAGALAHTGNTVVIDHGQGLRSFLFHLQELAVETGDALEQTDTIGSLGATGYAQQPHLHYELRLHGVAIDPAPLFSGAGGYFMSR